MIYLGTAVMVIVQFRGHLVRQYRACVVDSLGLGITVLCVQGIPILSPLLFMPSLYSEFFFDKKARTWVF